MIGIKKFEMPSSCAECPFLTQNHMTMEIYCLANDEYVDAEHKKKRSGNCPLVELGDISQ
jgi:hypothetical protein